MVPPAYMGLHCMYDPMHVLGAGGGESLDPKNKTKGEREPKILYFLMEVGFLVPSKSDCEDVYCF